MACNYTECNYDQLFLLPPNMKDWLPAEHLAWFLLDAIEQMDLSPFHAAHRCDGKGGKSHHPKIILAVMLYGYCQGERSSRKLERFCMENVPYRILAANTKPDHCTFARFRKRHSKAMKSLFIEILRLCAEAGLVNVGKVNLDGTKMKANASLSANRTEKALEKEIEKMLAEAKAKDAEEDTTFGKDRRGDELPKNLRSREDRLQRLRDAKNRLEQERFRVEEAQRKKIERREQSRVITGREPRGKKPKSVEEVRKKQEKRKANPTAPDTRIMKTRGGYVQGFNGQAVCTDEQIILAADVGNNENDQGQYHPMMDQAQSNATAVLAGESSIKLGRADAGYCNEHDLNMECDHEILMATTKDWKRRKALRESPSPRGRIPKHFSATDRMERKLVTKRGIREYKKRSQTIEPIFGQIKSARGIDSFYSRDLASARGEWNLICATNNLLKLFISQKVGQN